MQDYTDQFILTRFKLADILDMNHRFREILMECQSSPHRSPHPHRDPFRQWMDDLDLDLDHVDWL